jgi:DNA polymerase-3 subunit beta
MLNFAISIERAALKLALDRADKVVERRSTLPILTHVCLTALAGRVQIRAFDLDMMLTLDVAATVPESSVGAALCVPLAALRDFVTRADKGAPIHLAATYPGAGDDGKTLPPRLTMEAGRARASLLGMADDRFLSFQEAAAPVAVAAFSLAQFVGDLDRVRGAASTEEVRYYLNGVYCHKLPGGGLAMAATDGHRLLVVSRHGDNIPDAFPGVIIPRKALAILSAVAGKKPAGEVRMAVSTVGALLRMTLTGDGWTLESKMIDGNFPDYTRVIPPAGHPGFIVDSEMLAPAIKRVTAIAAGRGKAVLFDVSGDKVTLSYTCPEQGVSIEETPIDGAGAAYQVGFNSTYLLDMLALAGADKLARFEGLDASAPFRVEFPGAPELLGVLMSMRV